jgi:hypothetical protein
VRVIVCFYYYVEGEILLSVIAAEREVERKIMFDCFLMGRVARTELQIFCMNIFI